MAMPMPISVLRANAMYLHLGLVVAFYSGRPMSMVISHFFIFYICEFQPLDYLYKTVVFNYTSHLQPLICGSKI